MSPSGRDKEFQHRVPIPDNPPPPPQAGERELSATSRLRGKDTWGGNGPADQDQSGMAGDVCDERLMAELATRRTSCEASLG